jgi:hypothetical protein
MENETQEQEEVQVEQKSKLHQVTPLSKYLALALFMILPFLGGWIGYTYAPEKVMEVEKDVIRYVEKENSTNPTSPAISPDLVLFPKDSSQITEIIIEESSMYVKFEDLVAVRNDPPKWHQVSLSNPDEFIYLGYGLFFDGGNLRTIEEGATLPEREFFKLDSKKGIDVIPLDDPFAALIVNGDKLYLHDIAGYSLSPQLFEIPMINTEQIESLGEGRYKVGQKTYLLGRDINTPYFKVEE